MDDVVKMKKIKNDYLRRAAYRCAPLKTAQFEIG